MLQPTDFHSSPLLDPLLFLDISHVLGAQTLAEYVQCDLTGAEHREKSLLLAFWVVQRNFLMSRIHCRGVQLGRA